MDSPEKRVEKKIAAARAAAQARHEARQQRAAQRQAAQQERRAAQRQVREAAHAQVGERASTGGRPLLADEQLHLHAVTVRLDAEQYRLLNAYTSPGGRTLAATIRMILQGRRVFTSAEHTLLRRVPDLANATAAIAQRLAGADPVEAATWRALAGRVDELLTGLHY